MKADIESGALKSNANEVRQALIDKRDLLGLVDYMQSNSHCILPETVNELGKCIRLKAKEDLSALTEDAFARIISMGTTLLLRTQLYIEMRLRESDEMCGDILGRMPRELTEDGWFTRAERISKFIGDMAALRARVRHLNRLEDEHDKQPD